MRTVRPPSTTTASASVAQNNHRVAPPVDSSRLGATKAAFFSVGSAGRAVERSSWSTSLTRSTS